MTKNPWKVEEGTINLRHGKKFDIPTRGAETGQLFNKTCYDSTSRVLTQSGVHVLVHRGRVQVSMAGQKLRLGDIPK